MNPAVLSGPTIEREKPAIVCRYFSRGGVGRSDDPRRPDVAASRKKGRSIWCCVPAGLYCGATRSAFVGGRLNASPKRAPSADQHRHKRKDQDTILAFRRPKLYRTRKRSSGRIFNRLENAFSVRIGLNTIKIHRFYTHNSVWQPNPDSTGRTR